jgi:NAD(P)-dependent dehydrogenase (short-subunit alcohol dehydrogenase family)
MSNWIEEQFSLTGKRALVTGASKGIGAAIAIAMAKAGADLILVGRTEESLSQTAKEVERAGRKATKVLCDLSFSDEIARAFSGWIPLRSISLLIMQEQLFADLRLNFRSLSGVASWIQISIRHFN